ncbi:trans-aconitate 2-methyltransferase [Ideonella azotifigens]|uniref:Trans-aconitate 2-methyltransferase n=1 Tax=Ideonella azotifigens TaxID=513160 RepID=A0ABP3URN9_9BURK|nr:trans-aconitate 2-methyltransferase [Ideonella azotifigens]MCD2341938.1 trans-aconitate 2-methyltransferase [Ideonella azotifigens]
MSDWNPALYTRFEEERTRPAAELLARVPLASAGSVVDLGCGPGNSTELLVRRFAGAKVIGMDSSPAMLVSARERLPGVLFEQGDIATWSPPAPVDLLYANASLQWLPGHEQLVPRLLSLLAPGGALAIQMPDNLDQPSHVSMRETAAEPRFAASIGDAGQVRARILPAEQYHDLLSREAEVDVWRTTYYHPMADAAAIVQWLRATGLKPFLEPLSPALQAEFLAAYQARIEAAYPQRADGQRLLAFPRLFIVARKKA